MQFYNNIQLYTIPFRYLRMSPQRLEHLLSLVGPLITKKHCRSRKAISPGERLVITLVFSHWRFTTVSVIQLQGRSKHSMCNNQRDMCSYLICTERSVSKVSRERGRLETNTERIQTGMAFSKLLRGCGWKTHLHRLSKRSRLYFL